MIEVSQLSKTYRTQQKTGDILRDIFVRTYKDQLAVKDLSFHIEQGSLVGFIGPNGAGKTTTLKMLSGILFPTTGTIRVAGHNPFNKHHEFLKQIGFIMGQKNQLIWELPAVDTFRVNKTIYEVPESEYRETLEELVKMLECQEYINQPVRTLSLGQRMRVEFIAALVHRPRVLFLDEPTIGLDIFAQSTIRTFIKKYQERYQATIILTSHYMQDVQSLANRVLLIDQGSIIFDGTFDSLIETYSHNKTITITLSKEISNVPELLSRFETSYKHPQLSITVPKRELAKTISELLQLVDFVDVSVENEPIEEVIKKASA
ncbi:MAG: ABC transporter ATP-binding protein [Patescibacteria group bacterium]